MVMPRLARGLPSRATGLCTIARNSVSSKIPGHAPNSAYETVPSSGLLPVFEHGDDEADGVVSDPFRQLVFDRTQSLKPDLRGRGLDQRAVFVINEVGEIDFAPLFDQRGEVRFDGGRLEISLLGDLVEAESLPVKRVGLFVRLAVIGR